MPDSAHSQCPAAWWARVALDAGEPAQAIELTARCLDMGDAHAPRTATIALLVAAAAHAALGDTSTADDLFGQALGVAAPTGAVRPFGTLARHELALLLDRTPGAEHGAAVRSLIGAIESRYPTEGAPSPENLSARERVVLARLTAGDTHQRIAFDLSVSPNTIKTHLANLFSKLGASTRTEAVARARELSLIP